MNVDPALAATVKDAYTRLPLTVPQRRAAVDSMLSILQAGSVPAGDVHEIAFYVLKDACPGEHLTAVVQVRGMVDAGTSIATVFLLLCRARSKNTATIPASGS